MKKVLGAVLLVLVPLTFVACGSDDEGGTGSSLMTHAGKVAPQLTISSPGLMAQAKSADFSTLAYIAPDTLNSALVELVKGFLKFGCHTSDLSQNYCAKYGITVPSDPMTSPYLMEGFMGAINLFSMKFDDVFMYPAEVPNCGRAGATAKSPTFSGSTAFLLGAGGGFTATLGCTGQANYGTGDSPYMAYSKSTEKETFVTASINSAQQGSYIYQGYVRKDSSGTPIIFAFNFPKFNSANGDRNRTLFVGNMQTNRIALKDFMTGSQNLDSAISVLGVAGRTESGAVAGYYGLRSSRTLVDMSVVSGDVCVNNGTATMTAGSDCSEPLIGNWLGGTTTAAQIKTYLGVTAEDEAIIGGWFEKLETGAILTNSDAPNSNDALISAIQ